MAEAEAGAVDVVDMLTMENALKAEHLQRIPVVVPQWLQTLAVTRSNLHKVIRSTETLPNSRHF